MPRSLTRQEIEYLEVLTDRNLDYIKKGLKTYYKRGLDIPMEPKERIMRQRIRLKALQMAKDLTTIYMAGVLPGGSIKCHEPCCIIEKVIGYRKYKIKRIDEFKSKYGY